MAAACSAARLLGLDRLILVPDCLPPHKSAQEVIGAEHRLAMVRLAAESLDLPKGMVQVSDAELRRTGKSYTVDTMREFRRQFPEDTIWLLMGTDMFLTFQDWYAAEEILQMCGLCAFGRTAADTEELFSSQRRYLQERFGARIATIAIPEIVDISSTALREGLSSEKTYQEYGRRYLAPAVYGYILRHRLYGTRADLRRLEGPEFRAAALSHLKGSRIPHVLGTARTAVDLARRWGADAEEARRAALLHDCTKRLNLEEQLALCEKYQIALDDVERRELKLLHAKTGAAVARDVYGVSDAVHDAIFWHTTGKADMTLLEKIIYLADYIEPTRDFCDLRRLRSLAFQDLDQAMLLGFTMAVEDLSRQGGVVHPNSVRARDYLKGKLL